MKQYLAEDYVEDESWTEYNNKGPYFIYKLFIVIHIVVKALINGFFLS